MTERDCTLEDFAAISSSEAARGNWNSKSIRQPPSLPSIRHTYALDLAAIEAEFDLPTCLRISELPTGVNGLSCVRSGVSIAGGPKPPSRYARRAAAAWWRRFDAAGRPKRPLHAPPEPVPRATIVLWRLTFGAVVALFVGIITVPWFVFGAHRLMDGRYISGSLLSGIGVLIVAEMLRMCFAERKRSKVRP